MKRRRLPLWLTVTGSVLLIPGILWFATSGMRVSNHDAWLALDPITRIPLDGVGKGPSSATLTVPNTVRWKKIRKVWGEPEFVISVVEPTGRSTLCLPEMPLRIELSDPTGRIIRLRPSASPYGYSSDCESSSLRFQADPGSELTLKVIETGVRTVPAGYLIIVGDWFHTKDKLVGVDLDEDIDSLAKWTSIIGCLLIMVGTGIFIRGHIYRHRGN
jgi:hypothetical protein